MNITEAITLLEASELEETYCLCWLSHEDNDEVHYDECSYCQECAEEVYDLLIGTNEKPKGNYSDIPDWANCSTENTTIHVEDGYYNYDTGEFCNQCGRILDVILSLDGIKYELDHFESIDYITNPTDKTCFLRVITRLEIAGKDKEKQLQKRAINLLLKLKCN